MVLGAGSERLLEQWGRQLSTRGLYDTTQVADQIVASDLNGDSKLDLAVPTGEPIGITVLWATAMVLSSQLGYHSSGPMVVGDFNGDRKPDVRWRAVGVITVLNTGVVSFPTSPLVFPAARQYEQQL